MDTFTLIIILGSMVLAIGLPILIKYLKDKNLISQDSLESTINLFKLSNQIVNELDLKYEKELNKISSIILLSLNYVYNMEGNVDRENLAVVYCLELCKEMNIEVTEGRIEIIETLIKMGLQDKTKLNKELN
jgi:hypothetical protein